MKQFVNVLLLHTATERFMIDWRKFFTLLLKIATTNKKEKCKFERICKK